MDELFITTVEEFEELTVEYNLENCGMSGQYPGWEWWQDDEAGVAVYVNIEE